MMVNGHSLLLIRPRVDVKKNIHCRNRLHWNEEDKNLMFLKDDVHICGALAEMFVQCWFCLCVCVCGG